MLENDEFWDFYWETRLMFMENMGKRAAVLAASRLIRSMAGQIDHPIRLLELGCGDGQIIGPLLDAHTDSCDLYGSVGVDYSPQVLQRCRQRIPGLTCVAGDFSDPDLLSSLGHFDLILMVNALHEVYSDCFSAELGEIDDPGGKEQVKQTLAAASGHLHPGGWLVLFDGLEPEDALGQTRRIRFRDRQSRTGFETFVREYQPFHIHYQPVDGDMCVELSLRDLTRYLTKSNFLGNALWETEKLQSYQYFTQEEFRSVIKQIGLQLVELNILTLNEDKWDSLVSLETDGSGFPDEHILILAKTNEKKGY